VKVILAAVAALSLVVAAAGCELVAQPPQSGQFAPAAAPAYHQRTLANGLTVLSAPDQDTATVTVQVWYRVGSKDDPQGRSGFAHLFEHMMFKASRNLPDGMIDQLTEDVGGTNNAQTWNDFTDYYAVVPANHLERILFAEADRMASLVIDEATFSAERNVVKEEYRERILADSYGALFGLYMPQESFRQHPYGRPSIGSIADLDAATLDEVRRFHATFYRPDNAVLVVAGRFDPAQLDALVDRYFAPIARPARPIPANDAPVPARTASSVSTYYAPNVPFPAAVLSYPAPRYGDPDRPALSVLNAILSAGGSSRLYNRIVYERKLANSASASLQTMRLGGWFALVAVMTGGHTVAEGEAALAAEVQRLRDEPVSPAELAEAKNELIASILRNQETAVDRAFQLGYSMMMTGDPAYGDGETARLSAVTADDVQRVARKYLVDSQRVTLRYLDEGSRAGAAAIPPTGRAVITLNDLDATAPAVTLAPPASRIPLPPVGSAVTVPTPDVISRNLDNGLRVVVAPSSRVPLASAWMVFDAGSSFDPADKAGLAMLVAELVTTSTTDKPAPVLAAQIEQLGAVIGASTNSDFSYVYANAPVGVFEQSLDLMTQMIRSPALGADDLALSRSQAIDGVQWGQTDPGTVTRLVLKRLLFGTGRYGASTDGTAQSLARIGRDDVVAFYRSHWRPSTATLIFVGDIDPERAFALAQRSFGDWQDSAGTVAAPAVDVQPGPRVVVVDQPGAGQAAVMAGVPAVRYNDDSYYPLMVTSAVLGGGTGARLNRAIRIERGLSYGAWASLASGTAGGSLSAYAQTRNDAAVEVSTLMLGEFARLAESPVPQAEIDARTEPLIGGFARSLETADGLGGTLAAMVFYGRPLSELADYAPKIRAVTPAQIQEAARRFLRQDRVDLVFYGDAKAFIGPLKARYPKLTLIPADKLDLDGPIGP
jgi:zinc protease